MNTTENKCQTKYPIVMIHGTGFRDRKILNYWGRIPKTLISYGSQIYYGHQDSWATLENNARVVKENIEAALLQTGSEKVNLIAHSRGGLEARYIISTLGMANKIASLTTIATPHHGSKTMDWVCRLPKWLFRILAVFVNLWFRILGDKNPDFTAVCNEFSTGYAEKFNKNNPDAEGVYYQSYAAVMKNSFSDLILTVPHFAIGLTEGKSDGLVTPESAKWTNFRGILEGSTKRGISHGDEVDLRRMRLSKKVREGYVNDICDVYVDIVSDLKRMGY